MKLSFLSILLLLSLAPLRGQVDISADLEIIRVQRNLPGLSAMAVKDGKILAQGATGVRRIGSAPALLLSDRVNIGSCTKWITATVAGRLVDRGVIDWSTRVSDCFTNSAGFHASLRDVTLDELLCHRAGVEGSTLFDNRNWSALLNQTGSRTEVRRWAAERALTDPPEVARGTYLYANQGYAIAAAMMEIETGKSWETLVREEVFIPARLASPSFGQTNSYAADTVSGHELYNGQTVATPYAPMTATVEDRFQAAYGPGGSISMTMADWAKFLHLRVAGHLGGYLSPATHSRLQTPFTGAEGYSRGVGAYNRSWATPGQALTHTGDIWRQGAVFWIAPDRDFITISYTNCRSANNRVALGLDQAVAMLIDRYADATTTAGPLLEEPVSMQSGRTGNQFMFRYSSLPGVRYRIESSGNLLNWTPANGAGTVSGDLVTEFPVTIGASSTFFRASPAP